MVATTTRKPKPAAKGATPVANLADLQARAKTGRDARRIFRKGTYTGFTHGFAPGLVQGNLAILPKEFAADFLRFCQLNPKPCPLIGMSPMPGDPRIPELGADLDIRTDLPKYRVWKKGKLVDEPADIKAHWRDDLVAFVLGCSFSFEEALVEDGMELRHMTCGTNVPMWRTNIQCAPSGPFHGPMVVSMRPLKPADAIDRTDLDPSVLDAESLGAIGNSKLKTVTVFDNLMPLPRHVPLAKLKSIGCGNATQLISTRPITNEQLQCIIREALTND